MEPNVLIKLNALDNTKEAFASLKKNLDQVESNIAPIKNDLDALRPTFARVTAAGTVAFGAISAFSLKAVQGAGEAEVAQRRLAHVIQTSTGASNEQVQALFRQAEAMEKVGVVSADAINIMQEEAASFDLSAEAIERLTPAAADFAVALYGINPSAEQARQAMTGLGKAMQGQLELLTRKGYQLDEDSQAILKNGTEHERVAEMVKILGSNYDNLNVSMRNTTEGGMAGMSFAVGELTDSIGESLIPVFNQITETLAPVIQKVSEWIQANPVLTQRIILATAAIAGLAVVLGTIALALTVLLSPIALIVAGFAALVATVYFVATQWQTLPLILQVILLPLKLVVEAVQVLYNTIMWVFGAIKEPVAVSISFMRDAFDSFVTWITDKVDFVIKQVKRALSALQSLPGVKTAVSITSKAFSGISDMFRAEGGPVRGNSPYIVGEVGPELFVPNTSGTIIPNNQLAGAGAGGNVFNITLSNNSFMGERDMAEKIGDQLIRIIKQNTRL
jgi:phage-related tail protein